MTSPLVIAVHRSLSGSQPEIEFVLQTLFTVAGHPIDVVWTEGGPSQVDVYYGPGAPGVRSSVWIPSCGRPFADAAAMTANAVTVSKDSARLVLQGAAVEPRGMHADLVFDDDLVFASYWILTGAQEPFLTRSKVGDLHLGDSPLVRNGALDAPVVSIWGAQLRGHFKALGREPVLQPWAPDGRAAFAFTHDVDYPEIIRWIEAPRHLLRGHARTAWRVVSGRTDHWTFQPWVTLAGEFGTEPCFYFMARQGSLLQYAMGTPDDFYDVRSDRFRRLFSGLRDAGAEIGLHASFHAHRDAATLRAEVERLETASSGPVYGNRHHYWHLDPDDPNTTLARHAEAGLRYDSSLGFEYYPGFRRGICHPFRPFHPVRREVIDVVQLPPAWMDDHFDRRLADNGIRSADEAASRLVDVAARTGGIVVVDYHSRGMNREIYPRWGAWLERFARNRLAGSVNFLAPGKIAAAYRAYARDLAAGSRFWTRAV